MRYTLHSTYEFVCSSHTRSLEGRLSGMMPSLRLTLFLNSRWNRRSTARPIQDANLRSDISSEGSIRASNNREGEGKGVCAG
jgi:hypothetical protein